MSWYTAYRILLVKSTKKCLIRSLRRNIESGTTRSKASRNRCWLRCCVKIRTIDRRLLMSYKNSQILLRHLTSMKKRESKINLNKSCKKLTTDRQKISRNSHPHKNKLSRFLQRKTCIVKSILIKSSYIDATKTWRHAENALKAIRTSFQSNNTLRDSKSKIKYPRTE